MAPLQAFARSLSGCSSRLAPKVVSERILDRAEAVREPSPDPPAGRSYGSTLTRRPGRDRRPRESPGSTPTPSPSASATDRGVALAMPPGRVRISPHIYNNADDLGPPGRRGSGGWPSSPHRNPTQAGH